MTVECKFANGQPVMIRSTEELPTKRDGQRGWIVRQRSNYPEFWIVLTLDGDEIIFHESQLSLDKLKI